MKEAHVSFEQINIGYEILHPYILDIEKEVAGSWNATGAARGILDITCDEFFENKRQTRSDKWYNGVLSWREKF